MQKERNKNNADKVESKYCKDNTKRFDTNYKHIMQGPYNKTVEKKTFARIMSHF